eukprot:TRINITY_DN27_c0_g1_i1.p1 TRINITY_DN27_c0_g1~~TRINITY_DN27_c0_g1_i1.p1  ORF type:complete len:732 (-),score=192.24 TRINITY_DN27_c0_g1_i1:390-2585(-)
MTSAQSISFPLLYHLSSSPFYFDGTQLHPNKVPVPGLLKPATKAPPNLIVPDTNAKLSKFLAANMKPLQATNLSLSPKNFADNRQQNWSRASEESTKDVGKKCLSEKIEEENQATDPFFLFEEFHAAEARLLAQLKTVHKKTEETSEEKKLKEELWKSIHELNLKKKKVLSFFADSENMKLEFNTNPATVPFSSNVLSSPASMPTSNNISNVNAVQACSLDLTNFSISQQPSDFAVANRYLMPPPTILAQNLTQVDNNSTLVVSARLFYHEQEEEMTKTQDGKQEVLQGIKKVSLDKHGRAVFNKLKIMEVSSKHKHQAFCLVFFLEEYTSQGLKKTLAKVKSAPFHVQSRCNKRKREGEDDSMSPLRALLKTSSAALLSSAAAPSLTSSFDKEESESEEGSTEEMEKIENEGSESDIEEQDEGVSTSTSPASAAPIPTEEVGNYIDITDLLVLPQKEAARRLGISESMLCKRFKECTKRKWPYRYLRKIDKVMNLLSLPKMDGAMTKEERDKLEQLKREREDCLKPVKIRITAHDKLNAFSSSLSLSSSSGNSSIAAAVAISPRVGAQLNSTPAASAFSPKEPKTLGTPKLASDFKPLQCKQEVIEDEIPTDVLETLEMLRGSLKEESTPHPAAAPSPHNSNSFSSSVPSPSSSFSFAPTITTHTPVPSFSASSSCPSFPCPSPSSSSILSSFASPSFFPTPTSPSSAPSSPLSTPSPSSPTSTSPTTTS